METYSDQEVQQILQKALLKRSGETLTRAQVEEIAQELGVSSEDFARAEAEWQAETLKNKDREEFIRFIRHRFRDRFVTNIFVGSGLVGINFLISQGITWALYPLLVGGILLLLEGWSVLATDSDRFERRFLAWHNQRQQDRLAQQLKLKLARAASEVTESVTRSAVKLTDKFTDRVFQKLEKWLGDK